MKSLVTKATATAALVGCTLAGMSPAATIATGLAAASGVVLTAAALDVATADAAEAGTYQTSRYPGWGWSGATRCHGWYVLWHPSIREYSQGYRAHYVFFPTLSTCLYYA